MGCLIVAIVTARFNPRHLRCADIYQQYVAEGTDQQKSRSWIKPKLNRRAATNPFRSGPEGLFLEGQCPWQAFANNPLTVDPKNRFLRLAVSVRTCPFKKQSRRTASRRNGFPEGPPALAVSWLTEWIRRSAQRVEAITKSLVPKLELLFRMHRVFTGYSQNACFVG